jgi:serine/threonine protein kinase
VKVEDEEGNEKLTDKYVIVMEECEGTARSLFKTMNNNYLVLSYLEQIATILKNAKPFGFNHRDLKSDNVMYKTVEEEITFPGTEEKFMTRQKKFLLIDFGFACATFDGVKYEGTLYFDPEIKCFRESRDLAMLVFDLTKLNVVDEEMKHFLKLVLTFDYKGKKCDMSCGCLPDFNGEWKKIYDFLDRDDVENPNTTPDGLLNAIKAYREGGIEACEGGFILNGKCTPSLFNSSNETPVEAHIASPVVDKDVSSRRSPFPRHTPYSPSPSNETGKSVVDKDVTSQRSPFPRHTPYSPSPEAEKPVGGKKHRTTRRRPHKTRSRRKTLSYKRRTYRKRRGPRSV